MNSNPGFIVPSCTLTSTFLLVTLKLSGSPVSFICRHKKSPSGSCIFTPKRYFPTFLPFFQLYYLFSNFIIPAHPPQYCYTIIQLLPILPNFWADRHPNREGRQYDKPTIAKEPLSESEKVILLHERREANR